jgi:hypothetical protein
LFLPACQRTLPPFRGQAGLKGIEPSLLCHQTNLFLMKELKNEAMKE